MVDIRLEEFEMVAIGEASSWDTVSQDNGCREEAVRIKPPFTDAILMKWGDFTPCIWQGAS